MCRTYSVSVNERSYLSYDKTSFPLVEDGSVQHARKLQPVGKHRPNLPNNCINIGMTYIYSAKKVIGLRHENPVLSGHCYLIAHFKKKSIGSISGLADAAINLVVLYIEGI